MSRDNPFYLLRTIWDAMRHADWKEAEESDGFLGVIAEFFRALTGYSAWSFFVQIESGWRPSTIRPILEAHAIESWGWGKQGDEFFFQVRLRQANWTQYLLQQRGVPLSGQLLDEGRRSAYRPVAHQSLRFAPGASPTLHNGTRLNDRAATSPAKQSDAQPEASASMFGDPVGRINRTVDRLAKW